MSRGRITGAVAAAATPLRDAGTRIDEEALGALLSFYLAAGLDGVLTLGTTGEGILLTGRERSRVAELVVEGAAPLPVIVHCGAQTTAETVALAAFAAEAGADGVAVIAPPYFPFAPEELLAHFAAAAHACAPLPFYVYEFEARSGYAVPVDVIRHLAEAAPNLAGLKVSDSPFAAVEPYLALGLDVFVGKETLVPAGLAAGAVGAVSGTAAAFPEEVVALVRDPSPEREARIGALRDALSARPFQPSLKAALGLRGLPVRRDVRAPLLPLSAAEAEALGRRLELAIGADALTHAI